MMSAIVRQTNGDDGQTETHNDHIHHLLYSVQLMRDVGIFEHVCKQIMDT